MQKMTISTRVARTTRLLASIQDHVLSLTPECQDAICHQLDQFYDVLQTFPGLEPVQALIDLSREPQPPVGPASERPAETTGAYDPAIPRARAGVYSQDLVTKEILLSHGFEDLLGIDSSQISLPETFYQYIHPDDFARVFGAISTGIEKGGTFTREFRVIRPDGVSIWINSIIMVDLAPDGRPRTFTWVNQDITGRKQAEEVLELAHTESLNERSRLIAIMEALPTGVAIINEKGGVVQSNKGYEEVWGGPRPAADHFQDYSSYKAWWVEDGRPVKDEEWASYRAIREGVPVTNQFLEIERFDGSHRFVLNSGAPIFNTKGRVVGCAVAVRDITERIQAENALRISERSLREIEERFQVAITALPMTVYTLDRELCFTWVYDPQFGITAENMLGKHIDEVFPDLPEDVLSLFQTAMESSMGIQREISAVINGKEMFFLLSAEPMRDEKDQVSGLIGVALDVTEHRRLEIEHREAVYQVETQRKVVENRERERQEIARNIHDGPIQTLVSLMFELQLTRESIESSAAQKELEHINNRLKGAVRELRDVVNNLRPPALLRFGLGKSLRVFVEDFRGKHPEIEVELLFDLAEDQIYFPEEITLSLYRLCQEGLNNVARHAQATRTRIRFSQDGEKIVLEIRDNGKGFLVSNDIFRGTQDGHFGLAGMRERVEAIGGEFALYSSPGSGTTIEVKLNVEQPMQEALLQDLSSPSAG